MAEEEAQHEPTMEETLSSIRRIIYEDGEPMDEDEESPEPEPKLAVEEAFDENILELTDAVEEDANVLDLVEPLPELAPVSGPAAMGSSHDHTLEGLVRELLQPVLKEWLDANLEPIVARAVERKITKLAGRADKD